MRPSLLSLSLSLFSTGSCMRGPDTQALKACGPCGAPLLWLFSLREAASYGRRAHMRLRGGGGDRCRGTTVSWRRASHPLEAPGSLPLHYTECTRTLLRFFSLPFSFLFFVSSFFSSFSFAGRLSRYLRFSAPLCRLTFFGSRRRLFWFSYTGERVIAPRLGRAVGI